MKVVLYVNGGQAILDISRIHSCESRLMPYFSLKCLDCNEYAPVVSTRLEEMSSPDLDQMAEQAGEVNVARFKAFLASHATHTQEVIELAGAAFSPGVTNVVPSP